MKKFSGKNTDRFSRLALRNTVVIFVCLLACIVFFFVVLIVLLQFGLLSPKANNSITIIILLFLSSLIMGITVSAVGAKKISKPIIELESATEEIAKGNFDICIEYEKDSELADLIENFNMMAKELKSNETLKNDFISNVSHEFKTPLAVIQSYSKSLRRKDLDDNTRKKYEEVLDNNIKKLTNLTTNILSLSKIENQKIIAHKGNFSLDEQIRQSILSLEPEWKKKNLEFNLNLDEVSIFGSEELLAQVWQNLIHNAIKFSKENDFISISLKDYEDKCVVEVCDNGIGMNEETLKHIFDKFYQGDTSHSKEGNGLGLALVYRILKISGGSITATSKENEGTTFVVTLLKEENEKEEKKNQTKKP